MTVEAMVAQCIVSGLLSLKSLAYSLESVWYWRRGRSHLLPAYMLDRKRSWEKDMAAGRPYYVVRRLLTEDLGVKRVAYLLLRTPALTLLTALVTFGLGPSAPAWSCMLLAINMVVLLVLSLFMSLLSRLVLGPYDSFNPDLQPSRRLSAHLYPDSSPLVLYVLGLICMTIVGFSAAYAGMNKAAPSFPDVVGNSFDPITWLYFTLTIASTVGFGDIKAVGDTGRVFVIAQLGAGSILLTWIATILLGQSPPDTPNETPPESGVQEAKGKHAK